MHLPLRAMEQYSPAAAHDHRQWAAATKFILSVLAIDELLDQIVAHLADSIPDLLVCACVSRSWLSCAQPRIFYHIHFPNAIPDFGDDELRYHRLRVALSTSPYLVRYIHHISVSLNLYLLRHLMAMDFPALNELTLTLVPLRNRGAADTLVQALMQWPTLRLVKLRGALDNTAPLTTYFESLSPHIHSLDLSGITIANKHQRILGRRSGRPRVQLTHLAAHADLLPWMTGPHSPFGVARLNSVGIREHEWLEMQPLIAHRLPFIEMLEITHFVWANDIDFRTLTALRIISFATIQHHIVRVLKALARLPPYHRVHALRLRIHDARPDKALLFKEFDRKFVQMSALHSVARVELEFETEFDLGKVRSYFPRIASANRLHILLQTADPDL